jgi:alpha-1,2-mannosyltransferase
MLGGIRNEDDRKVVEDLREYALQLDLEENTDFKFQLNTTLDELCDAFSVSNFGYCFHSFVIRLQGSMFGIHTMLDEHFGIAVVEMMAAGLIVVSHESG